ncbi:uncharacterized protein LOC122000054 [Zingiber officinale]|uniref:uncharacterized protein LOC122000054 n=1 Tax=Zingiber officinale TaxID=94328 RepID=UPI001C4D1FA6|nr:uncharacterized protein LOC122000054 [Zingiber officinale]
MDRLTKSAHFLPVHMNYNLDKLATLYMDNIVRLHGVPASILSDRDPRFVSHFWQSFQKAMGTKVTLSTAYHPQTDGQTERAIQTLEDMLRACAFDFNIEKVTAIKERLKTAQDRQKSWADLKRRPVEFKIGDKVYIKISPMKGVVRFNKVEKLNPRYVGPFEILEKVGSLAYRLALPPDMSRIHNVFHVSQLRRYIADPRHILEAGPLLVEGNLNEELKYEEVLIRIIDTKDQVLRRRTIPYVKVQWSNHTEKEATWEPEEKMRKHYPYLFEDQASSNFEDETSNKEGGM